MKVLNVSLPVFKKSTTPEGIYYTEQTVWIGESVEKVTLFAAKSAGADVVVSVCAVPKAQLTDFKLIAENLCESEDDALAMVLYAV